MYRTYEFTKNGSFLTCHKYCQLNLGKVFFEKTLVLRYLWEMHEKCSSKEKYKVTIIFHNKTKLAQKSYVVTILNYLIGNILWLQLTKFFFSDENYHGWKLIPIKL